MQVSQPAWAEGCRGTSDPGAACWVLLNQSPELCQFLSRAQRHEHIALL
jgi:hypothetical protein